MYEYPMAAVTKDPQTWLKTTQTCSFWRSEVQNQLHWAKVKVSVNRVGSFQSLQGKILFQLLTVASAPWLWPYHLLSCGAISFCFLLIRTLVMISLDSPSWPRRISQLKIFSFTTSAKYLLPWQVACPGSVDYDRHPWGYYSAPPPPSD